MRSIDFDKFFAFAVGAIGSFVGATYPAASTASENRITLPQGQPRIVNFGECQPPYPRIALRFEIQGVAGLEYAYDENGSIIDASIKKTSGDTGIHKILDQALLDSVKRCKVGMPSRGAVSLDVKLKPGKGYFEYVYRIEGAQPGVPSPDFSVAPKNTPPAVVNEENLKLIANQFYYLPNDFRKDQNVIYYWTLSARIERKEPDSQSILVFNLYNCDTNVTEQLEHIHYRLPFAKGEVMYVSTPNQTFFKPSRVGERYPLYPVLRNICQG
jgi:hypothetical protein